MRTAYILASLLFLSQISYATEWYQQNPEVPESLNWQILDCSNHSENSVLDLSCRKFAHIMNTRMQGNGIKIPYGSLLYSGDFQVGELIYGDDDTCSHIIKYTGGWYELRAKEETTLKFCVQQ